MAKAIIKKEVEEAVTSIQETVVPAQKHKFTQTELVLCRSVTIGGLNLTGAKSGEPYRWEAYGDDCEVEYRDLVSLIRGKSSYIYGPMFIIDNEEMVAEFPELQKFYDDSYSVKDLEGVLDLKVGDMVATMKTLPTRAINTLKSLASTKVANGELDSVRKIKALDDFFGTELNLLASLIE